MSALGRVLANTPVGSIEDVIARMSEIDDVLPPTNGVSCFNKLYLAATLGVAEGLTRGHFADPAFLTALDVSFANLYFAALRMNEQDPRDVARAWQPLLQAQADTRLAPIQFAVAGMNAHINRDLAPALVETFLALGQPMRRDGAAHADYLRVNAILEETEAKVKQELFDPLLEQLDLALGEVDDVVASWSVRRARDAAWTNGEALWHLRAVPALAHEYLQMLDRLVGFAGRGLLVPTHHHP